MKREFLLTPLLVFLLSSLPPHTSSAMTSETIQNINQAIDSAAPHELHKYYIYRSRAHFKMGDIQSGLSDLETSLHFTPTAEAYILRGEFYQSQHRYEEAINDYSAALELNNRFLRAYLLRSQAYYGNKEFDMALIDASYIKMYDEDNRAANNIIEKCYINMSPRQQIKLKPNLEAIRRASRRGTTQKTRYSPRKKATVAKAKRKKATCAPSPRRRSS